MKSEKGSGIIEALVILAVFAGIVLLAVHFIFGGDFSVTEAWYNLLRACGAQF